MLDYKVETIKETNSPHNRVWQCQQKGTVRPVVLYAHGEAEIIEVDNTVQIMLDERYYELTKGLYLVGVRNVPIQFTMLENSIMRGIGLNPGGVLQHFDMGADKTLNTITKIEGKQLDDFLSKAVLDDEIVLKKEKLTSIGLTERQKRNIHLALHGIPPKRQQMIMRFKELIPEYEAHQDIFEIIEKYGYTDQSHLIRDFRQMLGITPKKYLMVERLNPFQFYLN